MEFRALAVVLLSLLVIGCAAGQKFDYAAAEINIDSLIISQSTALAVLDQRPYVKSGNKRATFVGLSRGRYGEPFDVNTRSGNPLGIEMTSGVLRAVEAKGISVQDVTVRFTDGPIKAIEALRQSGLERLVLFTLNEWRTDTLMRTRSDFGGVR
jgi:hypothetical protein